MSYVLLVVGINNCKCLDVAAFYWSGPLGSCKDLLISLPYPGVKAKHECRLRKSLTIVLRWLPEPPKTCRDQLRKHLELEVLSRLVIGFTPGPIHMGICTWHARKQTSSVDKKNGETLSYHHSNLSEFQMSSSHPVIIRPAGINHLGDTPCSTIR